MPNNLSVENNFIGGLKTEFTGLNFPENACTQVDNCVFSLIGDVLRREGINYEDPSNSIQSIDLTNAGAGTAISTFRWTNAGGDGQSEVLVLQVGNTLYFFYTSVAGSSGTGISSQLLTPTINFSIYLASGSSANPSLSECQYAAGNGYLFVFHPNCDPFYCTFSTSGSAPAIVSQSIIIQTRDFAGIYPEPGNPSVTFRPTTLTNEHQYNLMNQGWTDSQVWSTTDNTSSFISIQGTSAGFGTSGSPLPQSFTFKVASGLTVVNGTQVNISWSAGITYLASGDGSYNTTAKGTATGNVTAYTGTSLTIDVIAETQFNLGSGSSGIQSIGQPTYSIQASNLISTISTWFSQVGNYPSNSDIWFQYKDAGTISGENGVPTFNPADTIGQVSLGFGQAPQGHYVTNEFNIDRTSISGVSGITPVTTVARPKTGAFYAGRVWYAGVDGSIPSTGDISFYTWTEKVYFSQILTDTSEIGWCYQVNDPTDENLNELLPTDGGFIFIQGSGSIFKLFPIQNGVLVFAANGVWFITGGSGLGFTADDYTVTKISAVKSISGTSIVDVNGLPMFWNEEGIYRVATGQGDQVYKYGGFIVEPLTVGTILSFYNDIPFDSRRYARGDYDPVSYVITWLYRSTQEAGISNRYQFDSALSLNIFNRAFYPYTFANNSSNYISGINYVNYPAGELIPQYKYLTQQGTSMTFSEENDDVSWLDWNDNIGTNYVSSFTTGYKVHGHAMAKWNPIYLIVYSNDSVSNEYSIQGIWDFATTNLGRTTNIQVISNPQSITFASGLTQAPPGGFGFTYRRHKIRGHGQALQLAFSSTQGEPFHIIGWAIPEEINQGA